MEIRSNEKMVEIRDKAAKIGLFHSIPPKIVLVEVVVGSNHECKLFTYFFCGASYEKKMLQNGKWSKTARNNS